MTGRGRPRKEKSPDSKLSKSRTRPQQTKTSPPRRAARTEKETKTTNGPKKQDPQKPDHTEEKPSAQKTRKGKTTNHFMEETNVQCRTPRDSPAPKTSSTQRSALETKATRSSTPKEKSSQKTKEKESTCQATFQKEPAKKLVTQPRTPQGPAETYGVRAKANGCLSDEITAKQTKTLKDIRRVSVHEKATNALTKMKQVSFEEKVDTTLHMTLKNLKIKKKDISCASEVVNEIQRHVIKHLKQNTICFKDVEEPLRTGSYYENLKISNPDEFDVMLPIPVDRVNIEPFGSDGAFYSVGLKRGKSSLQKFEEEFEDNSILSATKMLEEFRKEVKECLKECKEWTMTKKKRGCPAVTLTTTVQAVPISLDLVLCLGVKSSWPSFTKDGLKIEHWLGSKVKQEYKRKSYYFVPKYEGRGTAENDGIPAKDVWRISFSHIEKAIIKNHGSEKTCCEKAGTSCCRKDCLKLVKHLLHLLKEKNPSFDKFCSYHAKTTLLTSCCSRTSDTDWKASDLSPCFQLLLDDFCKHLRNGQLCNFFIPSQNLLSGPGAKMCGNLADCIKEQCEKGFPIFQQELKMY
ncbi:cyclic GMP-AMP synthase [Cololabis saira]|uniref:cyclic GMP-AMP synthase n=1 Tax=Cololabis saira TaxID=129043 RepID=UPI002AD3D43D|nr:cyclic GMP-AMP synthase [Cololabis saira]